MRQTSQGEFCSHGGRGACFLGGCFPGRRCGIPACTEADSPPVNRMTDRCKNITLATTSLRPVKIPIMPTLCILKNLHWDLVLNILHRVVGHNLVGWF